VRLHGEGIPRQPPPEVVGCVNCGQEFQPDRAVFAQCEVCGKVCGFCKPCAEHVFIRRIRYPGQTWERFAATFVNESMAWHEDKMHRLPPRWERARLTKMPKARPRVELF
jgi:hypothetical protein